MSVTFCVQLPPEATVAKLSLRRGGVYCFRAAPPAPARHPMAGQSLVDVVTGPAAETFFGIIASGPVTVRRGKPAAVSLYSEVNVTGADCDLLHTGNALEVYVTDRKLEQFATIDKYVWGVVPDTNGSTRSNHSIPPGYTINVLGLGRKAPPTPVTPVVQAAASAQAPPAAKAVAQTPPAAKAATPAPGQPAVKVVRRKDATKDGRAQQPPGFIKASRSGSEIKAALVKIGAMEKDDSPDDLTRAIAAASGSPPGTPTRTFATARITEAINETMTAPSRSRGGKKKITWKVETDQSSNYTATITANLTKANKKVRFVSEEGKGRFKKLVVEFIAKSGLFDGTTKAEIAVTVSKAN